MCNWGTSARTPPAFDGASAAARADRRPVPTPPRSWEGNPTLNSPQSGLSPDTHRTHGGQWRAPGPGGGRRRPRGDAHLSVPSSRPGAGTRSPAGVAEGSELLPRSTRLSLGSASEQVAATSHHALPVPSLPRLESHSPGAALPAQGSLTWLSARQREPEIAKRDPRRRRGRSSRPSPAHGHPGPRPVAPPRPGSPLPAPRGGCRRLVLRTLSRL